MSEQEKEKNEDKHYETEWSFSFEQLSDQIGDFFRSLGDEVELQTEHLSEPIGEATRARVRLDLPVCQTTIKSITTDNLIEADVTHLSEVRFASNMGEDGEKMVSLSQRADAADWARNLMGWMGSQGKLKWDVGLTNRIPLDLDVHSGVGQSDFDLRGLRLKALGVYGGAGEITLTLPVGTYPAKLSAGLGEFEVNVPSEATVDLDIRAGTGAVRLHIGTGAVVDASVRGGVGEFKFVVPETAAVRIEARMGVGDVSVPQHYVRVEGAGSTFIGKNGVWQTADYDATEHRITLKFEGGVGDLSVKTG